MNDNNTTKVYLTESLSPAKEKKKKRETGGSFLASLLKIVGILTVICGVALGIFLANSSEITVLKELLSETPSASFNIVVMLTCWVFSFVAGMVLVGLGELIRLVQVLDRPEN